MYRRFVLASVLITITCACLAEPIDLKLVMPQETFHPGDDCFLLLSVEYHGPDYLEDLDAYVALTFDGTEYFFFPSWVKFPSEIDSYSFYLREYLGATIEVFPEFRWPAGAGEFTGAQFLAVVMQEGQLLSCISDQFLSNHI